MPQCPWSTPLWLSPAHTSITPACTSVTPACISVTPACTAVPAACTSVTILGALLLPSPPLSAKTHWHLLRVSPVNLRTYQTFPSGKRVTSRERETRDSFFEYRA